MPGFQNVTDSGKSASLSLNTFHCSGFSTPALHSGSFAVLGRIVRIGFGPDPTQILEVIARTRALITLRALSHHVDSQRRLKAFFQYIGVRPQSAAPCTEALQSVPALPCLKTKAK